MADDAKINSLSIAASDLNLDQHNQKPNLSPTDEALNNMECDPPMSNDDHNKPQQHCQNITHGVNALNITSNNLDKTAQQFWPSKTKVIAIGFRATQQKFPKKNNCRKLLEEACTLAKAPKIPFYEHKTIFALHFLSIDGISTIDEDTKCEEKQTEIQKKVFEASLAYMKERKWKTAQKYEVENCIRLEKPIQMNNIVQNQGWTLIDTETIAKIMIDPKIEAQIPSKEWYKIERFISIAARPCVVHALLHSVKCHEIRQFSNKFVNFNRQVCVYINFL
ncbi:MAG: hypothetical protein GY941_28805 [Planctomycetes bacterium]|nr:hypothetical protein [Planctomycetota bacterium]